MRMELGIGEAGAIASIWGALELLRLRLPAATWVPSPSVLPPEAFAILLIINPL